jgi:hypothetical protein
LNTLRSSGDFFLIFYLFLASALGVGVAAELPHHVHGLVIVQEVERVAHEQVHHAALPARRHANPRRYVFF